MHNLTDEQLVDLYIKGDREALNRLIKRYLKPIYNFAKSKKIKLYRERFFERYEAIER